MPSPEVFSPRYTGRLDMQVSVCCTISPGLALAGKLAHFFGSQYIRSDFVLDMRTLDLRLVLLEDASTGQTEISDCFRVCERHGGTTHQEAPSTRAFGKGQLPTFGGPSLYQVASPCIAPVTSTCRDVVQWVVSDMTTRED